MIMYLQQRYLLFVKMIIQLRGIRGQGHETDRAREGMCKHA